MPQQGKDSPPELEDMPNRLEEDEMIDEDPSMEEDIEDNAAQSTHFHTRLYILSASVTPGHSIRVSWPAIAAISLIIGLSKSANVSPSLSSATKKKKKT